MRRDFCSFLLTICPCLQEYGNMSYYSKHTSSPGHHELDRGPVTVVSDNNSSSSSSNSFSNGLTGPPIRIRVRGGAGDGGDDSSCQYGEIVSQHDEQDEYNGRVSADKEALLSPAAPRDHRIT